MEANNLLIILLVITGFNSLFIVLVLLLGVFHREKNTKEMMVFNHNLIKRLAPRIPPVEIIKNNIENLAAATPKEKPKGYVYNPSRDKDREMRGDRIDGFD